MTKLEKIIRAFLLLCIGIGIGYAWHYMAIANAYEAPVSYLASPAIKAAMQKMGPLYHYKMVGETLYVKPNEEWLRLKYR